MSRAVAASSPADASTSLQSLRKEQVGQLRRELECARRLGQVAVQRQDLGGGIVVTDQSGVRRCAHHADAEPFRERTLERGHRVAVAVDADVRSERLGRDVQFVDVVVAVVKEVANFLVRHQRVGRVLGPHLHRLVEAQDPFVERAVGPVQGEVLTSQRRRRRGCHLEFGQRGRRQAQAQVGAGLAQVGDQPGFLVAVELARADDEDPRERDQHPRGDGSLVGLDLRQIAGRKSQQLGAGVEGKVLAFAQGPDLGADKELLTHLQFRNFAEVRKLIRPFLQASQRPVGAN